MLLSKFTRKKNVGMVKGLAEPISKCMVDVLRSSRTKPVFYALKILKGLHVSSPENIAKIPVAVKYAYRALARIDDPNKIFKGIKYLLRLITVDDEICEKRVGAIKDEEYLEISERILENLYSLHEHHLYLQFKPKVEDIHAFLMQVLNRTK